MVSKLRKHLIVEKGEDDSDFMDDLGEYDEEHEEVEQRTDPRWDELKKLLDNN
jgi:uncharacterized metal-binding protein YceD (DUF177 family)